MKKKTTTATTFAPAALADLLASQAPDGWTVTRGVGYHDGWESWTRDVDMPQEYAHVVFAKAPATIALNVRVPTDDWSKKSAFSGLTVEGHTLVNGRSFTRRGIDCSSCDLVDDPERRYSHDYGSLAELLAGEFDRCVAADARQKTAEPVPGLPFERQPEWFASTAASLKAGKRVDLAPHSMGTGYTLSLGGVARRKGGNRAIPPSPYARRADPALEQRLGVSPVYVSTFDYD